MPKTSPARRSPPTTTRRPAPTFAKYSVFSKELAAAKKQLEKANNKLAGLGRQNGRKEDLSGAKSKKDDKPKPKPRDKDTAPSSEGAAQ